MMTTPPPPPAITTVATTTTTTTVTVTTVTILGLGSLLSERSSRTTFPKLINFRLGRVSQKYRRVFGHPASIFFQRGLANIKTKEFSSLSAEKFEFDLEEFESDDGSSQYRGGFICSVFEVPREEIFLNEVEDEDEDEEEGEEEEDGEGNIKRKSKPTGEFLEREEEFDIVEVPFVELANAGNNDDDCGTGTSTSTITTGVLCTRFTDEGYIKRWGIERFNKHYNKYGIETIWGYKNNSGLRPCRVYLRHCYLAAQSMGPICLNSFLDETFLIDRITTIRQYLEKDENYNLILNTIPPPGFEERYSG
jgi:hypothetical protein